MSKSKTRLWLDRIGLAVITVLALGLPILLAFIFYLGVRQEGVFINEGDPLRQGRIWMQHERTGPVGLGLQTSEEEAGSQGQACARATITFLRWSPKFELTRERGELVCF